MKKIVFSLFIVIASFVALTITCSAAYLPYTVLETDNLVESAGRSGITTPSKKWDLSESNYYGSFEYSANVYGNYLLSTSTGTINFSITTSTQEAATYGSITIHRISLVKKGFLGSTTSIQEVDIDRDGTTRDSFPNLTKNSYIYFAALSKATDGAVLSGTFTLSE